MSEASTITAENAKFHCRTCLVLLPFDYDGEEVNYKKEKRKFFDITASAELQRLISANTQGCVDDDDAINFQYPPNVCRNCFKKLQILKKFRRLAQQSVDTLRSVFETVTKKNQPLKLEDVEDKDDEMPLLTRSKNRRKAEELLRQTRIETTTTTTIVTLCDTKTLNDVEKFDVTSQDRFFDNDDDENLQVETKSNTIEKLKSEIKEDIVSNNDNELTTESDVYEIQDFPKADVLRKKKRSPRNISGLTRSRVAAYRCETCQRRFVHKYHLDAHQLREHEGAERPYACDQCDKNYKTLSALRYHKIVAHKPDTTRFPCNVCGKEYKTVASLKNHKRELHLNQKRAKHYVCEHCGSAFLNNKTLTIHTSAKHSIGDCETEFRCDKCDKLFQSPYTLKYHVLNVHLQERNCECGVCGAGFAKKFMLIQHMKSHSSDEEKYPCDNCEKRFQSKSDVARHIRVVHLKIKPFNCKHCGESFGSPKTLRFHTYIHTGEKPYVCDVCGVRFRQPTAMKTHRTTHLNALKTRAVI